MEDETVAAVIIFKQSSMLSFIVNLCVTIVRVAPAFKKPDSCKHNFYVMVRVMKNLNCDRRVCGYLRK
jgi:hypothetical protein